VDIAGAIDIIISLGGLILGSTYVIGGLIVNLQLSAYGITQYQILRIKYLAVGLTYLANFLAVIALAAIPAMFLIASNLLFQQLFLIASLLASIFLLWLWGKTTFGKRSVLFSWRSWVALGAIAFIYPLMVAIRLGVILGLAGQISYEVAISLGQAVLAIILSFMGSIYYYARHLYGRQNVIFGSADPIGMGIPIPVQLAGESENISLLAKLEVPLLQTETTDRILLLDETNTHYIVGISNQEEIRAVEVAKDMVKAIRYF
jgi:hypothetical protein